MSINFSLALLSPLLLLTVACTQQISPDTESVQPASINTLAKNGDPVSSTLETFDIYKAESCGCCGAWVSHLEENNFSARIHHPENLNQLKTELGVAVKWQSCHTAVSEQGYVFEGHIPANVITQFLADPPRGALGLAVPGMPLGSPGMEVGERFSPYDVLLLKKDGSIETYHHVASREEQY